MPALPNSQLSLRRSFRLLQRLQIRRFSSSLPESSPQADRSDYRRSDFSLAHGMMIAAGAGLGFAGLCLDSDPFVRSSRFKFLDVLRREIAYNSEKKLRFQSSLEKVFEYFASVRTPEGELLMKPTDLMRAIVPVFPSSESDLVRERYGYDERNLDSEFFKLVNVDNDGRLSFKEFLLFVTLLSFPESSFTVAFKMFDTDNDGEIDKEEFKTMMNQMRSQRRRLESYYRVKLQTELKMFRSDGGLVDFFFGKDGCKKLKHDKFIQFIRNLTEEMFRLEFAHYDYKRKGSISAKDFALSIAAAADVGDFRGQYRRANEVNDEPHLKEACGVTLSDNVIEIAFHVFDSNKDGNLDVDKLLRLIGSGSRNVFQTHFYNGVRYPRL